MQTRAKWSRWGWGACEGYGLEIGETFRCTVVLKPGNGTGEAPSYTASINAHPLGQHPDRESAMRTIEKELESRMNAVQRDWTIYEALKALNGGEVPRMGLHARRR
jgi:hypothetical protein